MDGTGGEGFPSLSRRICGTVSADASTPEPAPVVWTLTPEEQGSCSSQGQCYGPWQGPIEILHMDGFLWPFSTTE